MADILTGAAAILYAALAVVVALFQIALAAGAPWGHLAMGGRWSGRLPPALRGLALVQAGLMVLMARVVLGQAEVLPMLGPGWLIWPVAAVSALAALANLATPSRAERRLWAPAALGAGGAGDAGLRAGCRIRVIGSRVFSSVFGDPAVAAMPRAAMQKNPRDRRYRMSQAGPQSLANM